MKKRLWWLTLGYMVAFLMAFMSCGGGTSPTTSTGTTVTGTATVPTTSGTTTTPSGTTTPTSTAYVPTYGGTLNIPRAADFVSFETNSVYSMSFSNMIYDKPFLGDINCPESKFPFYGIFIPPYAVAGNLVDSWERPDGNTIIMHLHQGVHFQNIAPVNGRELTSDDVVYSMTRLKGSDFASSIGYDSFSIKVEALDKYTVKWTTDLSHYYYGSPFGFLAAGNSWIIPKEVVAQYGNLTKPLVQVGSGPFIVKDYVPGSSMTFARNPTYWETDTRFPGNKQLPYIDSVKFLVIADVSTCVSAMRTGKVDMLTATQSLYANDALNLINTSPQLKYREMLTETAWTYSVRMDVKPFDDIRVRQALSMAIDRQSIIDKYFKGHAVFYAMPASPGWTGYYIAPDQLPDDIKEVYSYNPTKAKQLLTDAGVPNLTFEVQISNVYPDETQVLQLIAGWYQQIGVTMNIKVMDNSAYLTVRYGHAFPQASAGGAGIASPTYAFTYYYQIPGKFSIYNIGNIYDAKYNTMVDKLFADYAAPPDAYAQEYKDLYLYFLRQNWSVQMPAPNWYQFWQPWVVGGYWGQAGLTYYSSGDMYKYLAIDKNVKLQITGSKD